MAHVALLHLDAVDARTAVILKGCGLLERDSLDDRGDQREMAAIVADPSHPKHVPLSLGPSVVVRQDDTHRVVVPVPILLLSSDPDIRAKAVEHLERMTGHDAMLVTPRTEDILRNCRAIVLSTESPGWRAAAERVYDAVKDDYLCNIAGLRQSAELGFDEGIAEYLTAVLRPTVTSLDSINLEFWNPGQQRSAISEFIKEVVGDSRDIGEGLDRYYSRLGHLPLADRFGVGEVVRKWAARSDQVKGVWERIWEWAERTPSPVRRYHACVAFVTNPHLITPEHLPKLWNAILEILYDSSSDEGTAEWTQAWRVRCDLARHYCHHLECRLPGAESERIANLSWWLAERVAVLLGKSPDRISTFGIDRVASESSVSSQIWHLAHPRVVPSALRYATLYCRSTWSVSLLSLLARALPALDPGGLGADDRRRVEATLKGCLFGMFPPSPPAEDEETYAFDRGVHNTAKVWAETVPPVDPTSTVSAFAIATSKLNEVGEFEAALRRLCSSPQDEQMLVTQALTVRAYVNSAPADLLFELMADEQWRNQVLRDGDDSSVQSLFDALQELTLQKNEKWAWDLPHRFVLTCEASWNKPERRALLFAMVVLSSLSTDSVSALQRLLTPGRRVELSSDIKYWRERIEEVRTLAPPWIGARLRAILAGLISTGDG
jgi:hypothetical protein